jgi:hypothetical protein
MRGRSLGVALRAERLLGVPQKMGLGSGGAGVTMRDQLSGMREACRKKQQHEGVQLKSSSKNENRLLKQQMMPRQVRKHGQAAAATPRWRGRPTHPRRTALKMATCCGAPWTWLLFADAILGRSELPGPGSSLLMPFLAEEIFESA